jgi:hypothetical protein
LSISTISAESCRGIVSSGTTTSTSWDYTDCSVCVSGSASTSRTTTAYTNPRNSNVGATTVGAINIVSCSGAATTTRVRSVTITSPTTIIRSSTSAYNRAVRCSANAPGITTITTASVIATTTTVGTNNPSSVTTRVISKCCNTAILAIPAKNVIPSISYRNRKNISSYKAGLSYSGISSTATTSTSAV